MSEKRPHKCGWCIADQHEQCRGETHWYDVTWICACSHRIEGE